MTELDQVVHNLTGRRFRNTSKLSPYQQGSSYGNSFYNPRNIGNYDEGQVAPEGVYATHYPVNTASNTMGFTILDDAGDDKRLYYPSTISSNINALVEKKSEVKGGAIGRVASSGSASDYLYFNPYYEALLNPQSHSTMEEVAQPHYIPHGYEDKVEGRGTNAPSSASAVDFAMNNPYAFKSNFNGFKGGALGASSSGSASDYYDSNPNRVPAMQNETRNFGDFMTHGGAIDWAKYLSYIRKGANYIPTILEKAPAVIEKTSKAIDTVKQLRDLLRGEDKQEKREQPRIQKSKRKPKQKKPYKRY
tara:strand:- start:42 stop:956 length:915 start_codon:yes stop_codon:yes gene_type:complete